MISLQVGQIKNRERLYKQIDEIEITDKGNLADALAIANNGIFSPVYGARTDVRKSLVVFVDGYPYSDKAALRSFGEKLKKKGITMVVIDVSSDIEPSVLEEKTPYYDVFFFPPMLDELDIALYPVVNSMQPGQLCFESF